MENQLNFLSSSSDLSPRRPDLGFFQAYNFPPIPRHGAAEVRSPVRRHPHRPFHQGGQEPGGRVAIRAGLRGRRDLPRGVEQLLDGFHALDQVIFIVISHGNNPFYFNMPFNYTSELRERLMFA